MTSTSKKVDFAELRHMSFDDVIEDEDHVEDILDYVVDTGTYGACVDAAVNLLSYALTSVSLTDTQRQAVMTTFLECVIARLRAVTTH